MKKHLIEYLKQIGLLENIPAVEPKPGTVLARGTCFLHDGNNLNSFMLFANGFACDTEKCHKDKRFGCNLEGLIRHMVYRLTHEVMPWREAWDYARKNAEEMKGLANTKIRHADAAEDEKPISYTADDLLSCLQVPDPLYLRRGYHRQTLAHFGVGQCVRRLPDGKNLIGWSVVPVWNGPDRPPHGYTARNPRWVKDGAANKWYHGVRRSRALFNSHEASAGRRDVLFICEGPGCVMRLYEAGYTHAVATLGSSMADGQYPDFLGLLDHDQTVYVAADADERGHKFAEQVQAKIKSVCEPIVLFPPENYKDVGDMPTDMVRQWLRSVRGILEEKLP